MTNQQLQVFRDRLWKLVLRLQRDASTVSEQAFGPVAVHRTGELSNAPMHLGDVGTEAYLQELNATLLENQEFLVQECLEAARRIDEGTFGRCENCGELIARARLDAIPFARHCTACAEALRPGPAVNLNVGRPDGPAPPNGGDKRVRDRHAAGSAGGGTAVGGLAGRNSGEGSPEDRELDEATASGRFDAEEASDEDTAPGSGRSGGSVGGTPAGKRARGGRLRSTRRARPK